MEFGYNFVTSTKEIYSGDFKKEINKEGPYPSYYMINDNMILESYKDFFSGNMEQRQYFKFLDA